MRSAVPLVLSGRDGRFALTLICSIGEAYPLNTENSSSIMELLRVHDRILNR